MAYSIGSQLARSSAQVGYSRVPICVRQRGREMAKIS